MIHVAKRNQLNVVKYDFQKHLTMNQILVDLRGMPNMILMLLLILILLVYNMVHQNINGGIKLVDRPVIATLSRKYFFTKVSDSIVPHDPQIENIAKKANSTDHCCCLQIIFKIN